MKIPEIIADALTWTDACICKDQSCGPANHWIAGAQGGKAAEITIRAPQLAHAVAQAQSGDTSVHITMMVIY